MRSSLFPLSEVPLNSLSCRQALEEGEGRDQGTDNLVKDLGSGLRVRGLGLRVWSSGIRDKG